jgi:hypothetical protein
MKNLLLFKNVIGEKNMANCVLVTTKWSQQSEEKSAAHEQSLMTNKNFWKPLLDRGARVERFQDSTKSHTISFEQLPVTQVSYRKSPRNTLSKIGNSRIHRLDRK